MQQSDRCTRIDKDVKMMKSKSTLAPSPSRSKSRKSSRKLIKKKPCVPKKPKCSAADKCHKEQCQACTYWERRIKTYRRKI